MKLKFAFASFLSIPFLMYSFSSSYHSNLHSSSLISSVLMVASRYLRIAFASTTRFPMLSDFSPFYKITLKLGFNEIAVNDGGIH